MSDAMPIESTNQPFMSEADTAYVLGETSTSGMSQKPKRIAQHIPLDWRVAAAGAGIAFTVAAATPSTVLAGPPKPVVLGTATSSCNVYGYPGGDTVPGVTYEVVSDPKQPKVVIREIGAQYTLGTVVKEGCIKISRTVRSVLPRVKSGNDSQKKYNATQAEQRKRAFDYCDSYFSRDSRNWQKCVLANLR